MGAGTGRGGSGALSGGGGGGSIRAGGRLGSVWGGALALAERLRVLGGG